MSHDHSKMGVIQGIAAFSIWGLMPSFWKLLGDVPAVELLCHRMIWSLVFVVIVLTFTKGWRALLIACRAPRTLLFFVGTSLCLGTNWVIFLYGVQTARVVECSLGYYINPLLNVALGALLLKEKKRRLQWVAVAFATVGVLYESTALDSFPWIAMSLAVSFGTYGLLRKIAVLGSLQGMALETAIFFPFALGWILCLGYTGEAAVGDMPTARKFILASSGVATTIPLLLFAASARKVHFSTLGIMQYIAPSLMFLQGVLIYDEPFPKGRLITFAFIWTGVIIYAIEGILNHRTAAGAGGRR